MSESTQTGYKIKGRFVCCKEVHTDYNKALDQLDEILDKTCFCVHGKIAGRLCGECEGGRAIPELGSKWETVKIVEMGIPR